MADTTQLRALYRWHRPLLALTGLCAVVLAGCLVGLAVDHRRLTDVPIWDKPTKFALSIAIYGFTMAWLISVMTRWRRVAAVLGNVSAVMLAGELALIVLQVVRGRTSHFDFATPFDTAVYEAMAVMIGTLWLANLALAVMLQLQRLPDATMTWAVRLGMAIAVIGMALAYLMTLPTAAQQLSWQDGIARTVVGAHTVGLADGGPGLPFLGWSTVGGDLRIPHFVGIHGLQVMILVALGLTLLSRRFPVLAEPTVRVRVVLVVAVSYVAVLAILTWQALRGQSVVHPDSLTLAVTGGVVVAVVVALLAAIRPTGSRPAADRVLVRS